MRLLTVLLICLFPVVSSVSAEQPEYINDRMIKFTIETEAEKLAEAGKTIDNAELQKQLAERKQYDAKPPASFVSCKDGEDVYDTVDDGVLIISRMYLCGKCDRLHSNDASGFVISEDGLAVTNHHVIENKDDNTRTFVAMTRDGKVYPIIEVLAADEMNDTALIRLGGEGFTPVSIARDAEVGERVHSITNPQGRYYQYSSGQIARFFLKPQRRNAKRVSVTSDYGGGSSGGPIFNDRGQVVAMVSEAVVVTDKKIVFYDSIPYESILALFAQDDAGEPRQAQAHP